MKPKRVLFLLIFTLVTFCLFGCEQKPLCPREGYYFYKLDGGSATIVAVDSEISGDVVIPDTLGGSPVTVIGEEAFYDCSYITSVRIPDSVGCIENRAFAYCTYLKDIYIGTGLAEIRGNAFVENVSLENVHIRDLAAWCQVTGSDGQPMWWAKNLFLNDELLTDVVIPDGVPFIGSCAFSGYKKLTSIVIPDSVTELKSSAFSYCEGLTEISLPESITTIGKWSFHQCRGITHIEVPNGVTVLEGGVFQDCSNLGSVTLPEGITEIGTYAFYGCTNLKEMVIPPAVREIGMYAFYDCRSLTEVVLPDYLQVIRMDTFENCLQLDTVVLPRGLCVVEEYAFSNCKKLTAVYHKGTVEDWSAIRFEEGNGPIQNAAIQHNYEGGAPIPSDAPVGPADPGFVLPEGEEERTVWEKIIDAIATAIAGIAFIILSPIVFLISTIVSLFMIFL